MNKILAEKNIYTATFELAYAILSKVANLRDLTKLSIPFCAFLNYPTNQFDLIPIKIKEIKK